MVRSLNKNIVTVLSFALLVVVLSASCGAMTLLSPNEGQNVRENVKIKLAASDVPEDGFIAVYVNTAGNEHFVQAIDAKSAKKAGGALIFAWDSKAPYRDASNARNLQYYKDGSYSLKVEVHDAAGKAVKSATVGVFLKNQVPRSNPAPAVSLVNRLAFGQSNNYGVHTNVQVFDAVGLPVMGGMGMSSDFRIIQSVEDVRDNGELLLRYTVDKAVVTSFGKKVKLYDNSEIKPQLYRLINKRGDVLKANMFSKQGKFTIMDVLPVLPSKSVKEGDTWPASFNLKIEGLTRLTKFTGTSMLDSFEWQNGHECAKIISNLAGKTRIGLLDGKISSSGNTVNAQVITYFAYKTGKMITSTINLEFPVNMDQGLENYIPSETDNAMGGPSAGGVNNNDDEDSPQQSAPVGNQQNTYGQPDQSAAKKGSVQINIGIALEK